ncbi:hypothetical protein [Pontibaca methylaminivorans]|uniref:hypothetical protein n=1 Tax=Pontibaca methylaminivorans TaxID=515897 RepID=UPI001F21084E|nr:hypothetical protein [Pontibaca methylaminivorans]
MAMPSNMSPPGELICTVTVRTDPAQSRCDPAQADATAHAILADHVKDGGAVVLCAAVAATGMAAHRASASEGASAWNAARRGKTGPAGRSRRLITAPFEFGRRATEQKPRQLLAGIMTSGACDGGSAAFPRYLFD